MTITQQETSALMTEAQNGKASAYQAILEYSYSIIEKYLKPRIVNKEQREDLTQEIIMALHKARHTYNPEQPFQNWLLSISRYKTIDYFRKNKDIPVDFSNTEPINAWFIKNTNFEEELETKIELETHLSKLTEKQQKLLKKVKIEGFSIADAARFFKMSIPNVKTSIHRAIKTLRSKSNE
jgi:RNA polymerase sigma-70 factor, ECF subfamily